MAYLTINRILVIFKSTARRQAVIVYCNFAILSRAATDQAHLVESLSCYIL